MEVIKLIHTFKDETDGEMLVFQRNVGKDANGRPMIDFFRVKGMNVLEYNPTKEMADYQARQAEEAKKAAEAQ